MGYAPGLRLVSAPTPLRRVLGEQLVVLRRLMPLTDRSVAALVGALTGLVRVCDHHPESSDARAVSLLANDVLVDLRRLSPTAAPSALPGVRAGLFALISSVAACIGEQLPRELVEDEAALDGVVLVRRAYATLRRRLTGAPGRSAMLEQAQEALEDLLSSAASAEMREGDKVLLWALLDRVHACRAEDDEPGAEGLVSDLLVALEQLRHISDRVGLLRHDMSRLRWLLAHADDAPTLGVDAMRLVGLDDVLDGLILSNHVSEALRARCQLLLLRLEEAWQERTLAR